MMTNPYLIGIVAGIASGLLLVTASMAGVLSALLLLASPLPVYLAVLAWGTYSGVAASVTAILLVGILASPQAAILVAALMTIPAMVIGHQANLAQDDEDNPGQMIWYPLSKLLFNMALLVAAGFVATGALLGFDVAQLTPDLVSQMKEFAKANPQFGDVTDDRLQSLAQFYLGLIPFTLPASWLVVHIVNMNLAVKIARSSGRMPRPVDDLPSTASLPSVALIVFFMALTVMMLTSGAISHIAACFAGALFMAFSLVGLAWLHQRARQNSGLRPVLFATYLLIILFAIPLLIFTVIGMYRTSTNPNIKNTYE